MRLKTKVSQLVEKLPSMFFCPRCDKPFPQGKKSLLELSNDLLRHVHEAHPDYDPEWNDTYPEDAPPVAS